MSVLVSVASGNFTTNTTWGLVDTTSYLNAENATESLLTTAYSGTRSSAFTPGAITVSHLGVKLCERIGTTGTMSVSLRNATIGLDDFVAGTEVTIDVADLPVALETSINGGWMFFKLATPILLLAANDYNIQAKTSSATQVDLWCDGTADNISRAIVVTTNQSPVAGDDLIIAEEKTGQGTANAFTVTMDDQSTTDYGAASTSLVTPALAICDGGTLTYATTAATNFNLRLSGHLIVYSGGILNMGTTGTPMPRGSTAVLEFDPAADGGFGLTVRNLGTFVAQGLSRTSGKNVVSCKLNTDEAAAQTTLGVDTDTGWLDGDQVVVASTTRTASQSELRTLSGNAGASSFDITAGLTNAHSGTSPTQAEVILLTRNVRIRSTSSTLVSFVNFTGASVSVDVDWVEFYYLGQNATGQRGIETTTSAAPNIQFSSVHDIEDGGLFIGSSSDVIFNSNVMYNLNSAGTSTLDGIGFGTTIGLGAGASIDSNILITIGGRNGIAIDTSAANHNLITNSTVVGAAADGFGVVATVVNLDTLSITGLTVHSCGGSGFDGGGQEQGTLTLTNFTLWRNGAAGINIASSGDRNHAYTNLLLFGNTTDNISINSNLARVTMESSVLAGDSTFATTNGISMSQSSNQGGIAGIWTIYNSDFGVATGIYVAHTNDIEVVTSSAVLQMYLDNCRMASTNEVTGVSSLFNDKLGGFIKSAKHDQTAGSHKSWFNNGVVSTDSAISNTAAPSERLAPIDSSVKLESGSKKIAVASGNTVTISVYVRESVVGDGTDYNGNRPRLVLKRNEAAGITADTVIDTATVSSEGAFEQLTGTTASVTDDAVLEFVVDCDGTTGWVNVDDWTTT